jgi:hypothetical protein
VDAAREVQLAELMAEVNGNGLSRSDHDPLSKVVMPK